MKRSVSYDYLSSLVRALSVLLVLELSLAWLLRVNIASTIVISRISLCVLSSLFFKYLLSVWGYSVIRSLIVSLTVWTYFETILGILQIYNVVDSNNELFIVTGSFNNPNPYAGFLVVLSSITMGYCHKYKEDMLWLKPFVYVSFLLVLMVLPVTRCRSSYCALIAVLSAHIWMTDSGCQFIKKHIILILLVLSALLTALYYIKQPSSDWRMFQNKISLNSIAQNNFFGSGLGSYGATASKTQLCYFYDSLYLKHGTINIPNDLNNECRIAGRCYYAFCDYLQIGVEAGALTMITFTTLIVLLLIQLYRKRSPFFLGILSMAVTGLFSYPFCLWQNELLFAIIVSHAVCGDNDNKPLFSDFVLFLGSIIVITYGLFSFIRLKTGTTRWGEDRVFYNSGGYELYCNYCKDKVELLNSNENFMIEYGTALSKTNNLDLSDSVLSLGFISSGNPYFLILKGDNSLLRKDYYMSEEYYWRAFCCIPDRIYPLFCLAKLYKNLGREEELENIEKYVSSHRMRIESSLTDDIRKEIIKLTTRIDED